MPALERTRNGTYKARKRIPDDVRAEYKRLYGQAYEAKLTIPGDVQEGDAKRRYHDWLSEHHQRISAIRAAMRGEGIELSHKDALALAGEWYKWFVGKHEDNPGDPEKWDRAFWLLMDAVEEGLPEDLTKARHSETDHAVAEWTKDSRVRDAVLPIIADYGHTAQFLAGRGLALNTAAQRTLRRIV
jgi:hypothetical protein